MANPYDVLPIPDPDNDNDDFTLRRTGTEAAPLQSETRAADDADASTVNRAPLPTRAQTVTNETTGLKEDLKANPTGDPPLVTSTGARTGYVSRGARVRTMVFGSGPYYRFARPASGAAGAREGYELASSPFGG